MATGDKLVTLDGLKSAYDSGKGMIAPDYANLTFPVTAGTYCIYGGALYYAKQDIASSEAWTAAHWQAAKVGQEVADLKSAMSAMDTATAEDEGKALKAKTVSGGHVTEWEFGDAGGGLNAEQRAALLACFQHVAWADDDGQDYYNALSAALNPPATLVSISAVYTQSGAVFTTDSLDSLKPDLVVTAIYDDSSTDTITTYTLSGTLTAGTSTITVSYGGKTTTFSVSVSEIVATISATSDNISFGSFDITKASTDYKANENTTRIACLGTDFLGYPCEYGYVYHFSVSGNPNPIQISVNVFNSRAKAAVESGVNGNSSDVYQPGWSLVGDSGFDVTPPATVNGYEPAFIWLAIGRPGSYNFSALTDMGTITISRSEAGE